MENNRPLDASAALDAAATARAGMAERLATPWWYHVTLGLLVAQMAFVQGLDNPNWTLPSAFLLILGSLGLVLVYRRQTGLVAARPQGIRARLLLALLSALAMGGIVVGALTRDLAVSSIAAVVVLVGTVVLGRRYDEALRDELREDARRRTTRPA